MEKNLGPSQIQMRYDCKQLMVFCFIFHSTTTKNLPLIVPDRVTSWLASAFVVSENQGLGFMPMPAKVGTAYSHVNHKLCTIYVSCKYNVVSMNLITLHSTVMKSAYWVVNTISKHLFLNVMCYFISLTWHKGRSCVFACQRIIQIIGKRINSGKLLKRFSSIISRRECFLTPRFSARQPP